MGLESKGFGARKDRTFLMEIRFRREDVMVLVFLGLLLPLPYSSGCRERGKFKGWRCKNAGKSLKRQVLSAIKEDR